MAPAWAIAWGFIKQHELADSWIKWGNSSKEFQILSDLHLCNAVSKAVLHNLLAAQKRDLKKVPSKYNETCCQQMAGERGVKVAGRRLADSLRASSGVHELLTRLVPLTFLTISKKLIIAVSFINTFAQYDELQSIYFFQFVILQTVLFVCFVLNKTLIDNFSKL